MKTKYRFIEFEDMSSGIYLCKNRKHGDILGYLEWERLWKCFVFMPDEYTKFSPDCLADIQHFMGQLKKGE